MWKKLQEELKPWVLHNFGERPTHQALLGITEEYGELISAHKESEIKDAVADMVIYIADYANSNGIELPDTGARRKSLETPVSNLVQYMAVPLGRLAHAHLKKEQGIRKNEDHDANKVEALGELLHLLNSYSFMCGFSLGDVVYDVWSRVKQRDWKKDAAKGGEANAK